MALKYGLIKAEQVLPQVDLIRVVHRGRPLIVSVFGPSTFDENVKSMSQKYANSRQFPVVTFREPTTTESISAAAYEFGSRGQVDAKRDMLTNSRWLQAGRIIRTSEGVYA